MVLRADNGTFLTQSSDVGISEREFVTSVFLKQADEALAWKQVTEYEKAKIINDNAALDIDKLDANYLTELETVIGQVPNIINDKGLTSDEALAHQEWFPYWGQEGAEIGKKVPSGFRFRYKEENGDAVLLYETIQGHVLSSEWIPGIATASLYKIVSATHAGTIEDPIPYQQGMAIEQGKYYTQDGNLYYGILTSTTGYPNDLDGLFTLVQKINMEADNGGVSAAPSVSELL